MRIRLALLGVLALSASAPPGWFPGAEWLVLVGLSALYALCDEGCPRPRLTAWLLGLCYVLAFSWSLRHVLWVGYVGIGLVGGLYFSWTVAWTRALVRLACWVPGPLAFGCAVAATSWLRAHMPEISYPHGQPIHALYRWPELLGPVALGGEVLGNLVLAALAAAVVDQWRAWRVGRPEWRTAGLALLAVVAAWVGTVLCDRLVLSGAREGSGQTLSVAAVEPGYEPGDEPRLRRENAWIVDRLWKPTLRIAGMDATDPPRLVLWPESSVRNRLIQSRDGVTFESPPRDLARSTALLLGSEIVRENGTWSGICLLLAGTDGAVLGWHEKEHVVPAGERVPFLGWLPEGVQNALLDAIAATMHARPDLSPGRPKPPLEVPDGRGGTVLLGAMLCYDNAFPNPARRLVAEGARLLVVLSNESWYRRGAELDQLLAASVMRCLETGCPLVRCTTDGHTVALDGRGRILARVEPGASAAAAQVLRLDVRLGPGHLPPLAWLHAALLALVLGSGIAWIRQVAISWARLILARTPAADPRKRGSRAKDRSATSP